MEAGELRTEVRPGFHRVTLATRDGRNTLSPSLIQALRAALDDCEQDPDARALIIAGTGDIFCNGMDLVAAGTEMGAGSSTDSGSSGAGAADFVALLTRMTTAPVAVIASIDGHVRGGGVGLIAACDFAFAREGLEFALPELLWGLLPCTIAPFVIRRIGPQAFRTLTLSTMPLQAREALAAGLVDSLESDALPRLLRRLRAIPATGLGEAKRYLNAMTPIEPAVLDFAVAELARLLASSEVQDRLGVFAATGRFPWELQRHGA